MRSKPTILLLVALVVGLSALPAAAQEPFPSDDWQRTVRFSGDHLYASFEWMAEDPTTLTLYAYDGNFKYPGTKGKGTPDQLVNVIIHWSTCGADGVLVDRTLIGATFTTGGDPVYSVESHAMYATLAMGGREWVYQTDGCSRESRVLVSEVDIAATLTIDGYFVTEECKRRCYAVCEFIGNMSLTHGTSDLLAGRQFDTIMEGLGRDLRGDIYWWAPPDGWVPGA